MRRLFERRSRLTFRIPPLELSPEEIRHFAGRHVPPVGSDRRRAPQVCDVVRELPSGGSRESAAGRASRQCYVSDQCDRRGGCRVVAAPLAGQHEFSVAFVPLIVPALVVTRRGAPAIGWRWWALTGLCFGMVTGVATIAARTWHVVERPTSRRVRTFVALAGTAAPAFTRVIDIALRARTPEARFADLSPRRRRPSPGRDRHGLSAVSCDRLVEHGSALVGQQAAPLRGLDTGAARCDRGRAALRGRRA